MTPIAAAISSIWVLPGAVSATANLPLPTEFSASMARCCGRSEEHTSELQSLMRISYAVFCLKKKQKIYQQQNSCIYSNTPSHIVITTINSHYSNHLSITT